MKLFYFFKNVLLLSLWNCHYIRMLMFRKVVCNISYPKQVRSAKCKNLGMIIESLGPIFVASFPCRIKYAERFLKTLFKICPQFCPTASSIRAWSAIKLLIFVLPREYIVHETEPEFWNMVENLVSRSVIYRSFGNFM